MFKHILVPIDLSDRNSRILAIALTLAQQSRARVTLVHVIHRVANVPQVELREFYRELRQKSERKLALAEKRFGRGGVAVRAAVLIGEPAVEIIKTAARHRVDLIVMGSHRVDPRRPGRGLGTTSYKVGIGCPCPIMLVK
jgi:universal stress protein A